jgi:hypothetical protein
MGMFSDLKLVIPAGCIVVGENLVARKTALDAAGNPYQYDQNQGPFKYPHRNFLEFDFGNQLIKTSDDRLFQELILTISCACGTSEVHVSFIFILCVIVIFLILPLFVTILEIFRFQASNCSIGQIVSNHSKKRGIYCRISSFV